MVTNRLQAKVQVALGVMVQRRHVGWLGGTCQYARPLMLYGPSPGAYVCNAAPIVVVVGLLAESGCGRWAVVWFIVVPVGKR